METLLAWPIAHRPRLIARHLWPLVVLAVVVLHPAHVKGQPASEKLSPILKLLVSGNPDEVAYAKRRLHLKTAPESPEPMVDVFVELQGDPTALKAYGARIRTVGGGVATADIPVSALETIANLPNVIRIEEAKKLAPQLDLSVPQTGAPAVWGSRTPPWPGTTGKGVVVGIVDTGFDLDHADFKDSAGKSRILYLWDQTAKRGTPPQGLEEFGILQSYGSECTKDQIDALAFSQKRDLVVASIADNTISALMATGGGSFATTATYSVGVHPQAVGVGDFNGDGQLDLAVANIDGTLSIRLGNGDGTFTAGASYDVHHGSPLFFVTTGDFNRDGNLDLVIVLGTEGNVAILLGTGDGTFVQAPQYTYGVGVHPQVVAVGDFNGDGIQDLAVTNSVDNTVSILLGKGDGTFGPTTNFTARNADVVYGPFPLSLAVGDFNGDGILDLAVTSYVFSGLSLNSPLSILLGIGDGTFLPPITIGDSLLSPILVSQYLSVVAVGDFDRNGRLDLALAGYNGLEILLGQADGTFMPNGLYRLGLIDPAVANPILTVGDFNGDGIADLAIASDSVAPGTNTVSILLGNGDGTFGPQPIPPYPFVAAPTILVGNQPSAVVAANFHSIITHGICGQVAHGTSADQGQQVGDDGHGTHVAGIAAGGGSATGNGLDPYRYIGMAPEASLIVVKLDSSHDSASVDGVRYIEGRAAQLGFPVVTNLSLGNNEGPHDGTSMYERALDDLTGPGRVIVVSAGNSGGSGQHASGVVVDGTTESVGFTVDAGTKRVRLDIWYDGRDHLGVALSGPSVDCLNISTSAPTPCGQVTIITAGTDSNNGDNGIIVDIEEITDGKGIQDGTWFISLIGSGCGRVVCVTGGLGLFDIWMTALPNARLAHFADHVEAAATVEIPATATQVIAVGSYVTKTSWLSSNGQGDDRLTPDLGDLSPFSSRGPRRSCSNASNPICMARVQKPELAAPGEEIVASYAAGTTTKTCLDKSAPTKCLDPDGQHIVLQGTSMSAPHVTGAVALLLAQNRNLTPDEVKAALQHTHPPDEFTGPLPNPAWGYGKLAVDLAIKALGGRATVPNVVGLTQAAAQAAITGANLVVGTVMQASSTSGLIGTVISEAPPAGTSALPGTDVNLVVSSGVSVPNVVGLTQAAAQAAIIGASLVAGTVTQVSSTTVPAGSVISQNPAASTSVNPQTAVSLVVSCGTSAPNVVGLAQAAAQAAITGANLVVGTVTQTSSTTVPPGTVTSQDQVAGACVPQGTAVNLLVSCGTKVPSVVGLTQDAAQLAIAAANLFVGTVTQASSATVPAGDVISQDQVAGACVPQETAVNLVVSGGPGGAIGSSGTRVPNVVGLTQTVAQGAITTANLVVGPVTQAPSATVPAGSVISESPPAGTLVAQGTAVNLVVSAGSSGTKVPDVVGLTQAAAQAALAAANLILGTVTQAPSATVAPGNVISESPPAGTLVALGTALNLVVSSGTAKAGLTVDPANPVISVGETKLLSALPLAAGSSAASFSALPLSSTSGAAQSMLLSAVPLAASSFVATSIATGASHTCALLSSGSVQCWGNNSFGQLGNGTTTGSLIPVSVLGINTATAIVAGDNDTCARLANGTVACWGAGSRGQMGNGTANLVNPTPVLVSGIGNAVAIAAGSESTCAVLADGTAQCWGNNTFGQLGNGTVGSGTTADSLTPVSVLGINTATAIAAGDTSACARLSNGTVVCWGAGSRGQMGNGTTNLVNPTPVLVSGIASATTVAAGGQTTYALLSDGTVQCWGDNVGAQQCWGVNVAARPAGPSGAGAVVPVPSPAVVSGISNAVAIAAGRIHACAALSDGTVACWGDNTYGELGVGTAPTQTCSDPVLGRSFPCSTTPMAVSGAKAAVAISASSSQFAYGAHTCALLSNGTIRCWGLNTYGELGDGTTISSNTPVVVGGISGLVATWSTSNASVATVDPTGLLTGVGAGIVTVSATAGATTGSTSVTVIGTSPMPDAVGRTEATALSAIAGANLVVGAVTLTSSTTVPAGSLIAESPVPGTSVVHGTPVNLVVSSGLPSISVTPADSVISVGQTQQFSGAPPPPPAFTDISLGGATCGVVSNGTVACWGDNTSGELGVGTTPVQTCSFFPVGSFPCSTTPVIVSDVDTAVAIAAGDAHACALLSNGTVRCWGWNVSGQLGVGAAGLGTCDSLPCSRSPVLVSGIAGATAIAAGGYHTCALLSNGTVACWGGNNIGQLGNGTANPSSFPGGFPPPNPTPVAVSGIRNAVAIAAGRDFTCALLSHGAVYCWGNGADGQLGDGPAGPAQGTTSSLGASSSTPVAVAGINNAVAISVNGYGIGPTACAVLSDGTVKCWGQGTVFSSAPVVMPQTVSGISNAKAVAVGSGFSCALLSDGTVQCWGDNRDGELGVGTTVSSSSPVAVSGINTATAIAAAAESACALLFDGTVRCWGFNGAGELGNGMTTNSSTPVPPKPIAGSVPLVWSSGDSSVATIDDGGRATGVGAGTVFITATAGSAKGSTSLTVLGATTIVVPNVVGLTQGAAQAAITGANLTVGAVIQVTSATISAGQVISETPAAGTTVTGGTAVNLVVAIAPRDTIPPTTTATATPPPNASGWNNTDVTVTLRVVDNPGGSGVNHISYAVSGPQSSSANVADNTATINISPEGLTTITYFAVDNAGNQESAKTLPVKIDKAAPTVSFDSPIPPPNGAGWNRTNVSIAFTAIDNLSGVATTSLNSPLVLTAEGPAVSETVTVTDNAGNSATYTSPVVKIDKRSPTIIFGKLSPAPNAAGWNNSNVSLSFTTVDDLSGIASTSLPSPILFTTEGKGLAQSVTATNAAGNSATFLSPEVNIDKTPPTIVGTRTPPPNAHGWNNTNVTVHFSCSDELSGLAPGSPPADTVLSVEGPNQSVSGTCHDIAGNSASAAVSGISIDKTPPTITGSRTPAPNAAGWNNATVTVAFTCADAVSGIDTCGPMPQLVTSEGANQSRTGTAVDLAGNVATAAVSGINIDETPPMLACGANPNVLWPPDHKMVTVNSSVAVSDALSGAAGFTLVSVTSSEPVNATGSGNTAPDIQGWAIGTASTSGQLRAERAGPGNGRIYTLTYQGLDNAGNAATCAPTVSVPHDQR